ncbi:MAG: hypothetical protein P8179_18790 [Candidatus Thiodiazotropha sp.]
MAIPAELSLTIERIGLNPEDWVSSVRHYNRHYFSVLGVIDCIKAYAKVRKENWRLGQRAVQRSYRLVIA